MATASRTSLSSVSADSLDRDNIHAVSFASLADLGDGVAHEQPVAGNTIHFGA